MTSNRKTRVRVQTRIGGVSATEKGLGATADINSIIQRSAGRPLSTGMYGGHEPRFMDVSSVDYLESLNRVVDAKNEFARYPSRIRARFSNDPYQLIRFLEDPENHDEARRLGILRELPTEPPTPPSLKADPEANPHKKDNTES